MAAQLSAFGTVPEMPGLFTATKNNLRCTAIVLQSGDLCLFSPVSGLSDIAKTSLAEIGNVAFLLAPNGYHNGGLVEYSAAYPDATVVANPAVHDRLVSRTELAFDGLDALRAELPEGMRLVCVDGLKNGETWLIAATEQDCLWHVVDAFGGQKNTKGKISSDLRPNKVFKSFGVSDWEKYMTHVKSLLKSDPPNALLPCHGAQIFAGNLTEQMINIYPELSDT